MARMHDIEPIIDEWQSQIDQKNLALAVLQTMAEDSADTSKKLVNQHILETIRHIGESRKEALVARNLVILTGGERAAKEVLNSLDASDHFKARILKEI